MIAATAILTPPSITDGEAIEVAPEIASAVTDVPVKHIDVPDEEPRPTLARPTYKATGLFQGWGPRLG